MLPSIGSASRACLIAAWCLGIGAAQAAEPPWGKAPYGYRVIDQDLQSVLREFGRNTGVPVRISPKVAGNAQALPANLAPRDFLDRLTATHGLAWYFDGGTLHVTPAEDVQARVVELPVAFDALRRTLADMGALDERYPIRAADKHGVAVVTGPPAYLSLVEQTIETLRRRNRAEVVVLRGGTVAR